MNERSTLKIDEKGHLRIGGADALDLAARFGTPLYVMDEQYIRDMCAAYRTAIEEEYGGNGLVLYASKAFCCTAVYKIVQSEGVGADVVSGGELYTARRAGFPAEKIYLHGNNKLRRELEEAADYGVTVVADAYSELDMLDEICAEKGKILNVLLRVNPGVEAHTHHYIQTAKTDSKFGFSVEGGAAMDFARYALQKKHIALQGFHSHIGSQIFELHSFRLAADKLLSFMADVKNTLGFEAAQLNLGGGFGIWYTDEDAVQSVSDYAAGLKSILREVKEQAAAKGLRAPFLLVEPGRSVVGEAGVTLYTVGAVKDIPGVKKYVAVDGGMFENPRYALYQAKYTAVLAGRAREKATERVSIAGKCCESGDIVCADVQLPPARRGDILAVLSTGAYNYSMASNYNRNLVPPVVLVKDGQADYIVKPQSYEDLVRNDAVPARLR